MINDNKNNSYLYNSNLQYLQQKNKNVKKSDDVVV